MMNLTGSPDTATEDGRKASWVATREYTLVPMGDGSFFVFSHKSSENNAYSAITL